MRPLPIFTLFSLAAFAPATGSRILEMLGPVRHTSDPRRVDAPRRMRCSTRKLC